MVGSRPHRQLGWHFDAAGPSLVRIEPHAATRYELRPVRRRFAISRGFRADREPAEFNLRLLLDEPAVAPQPASDASNGLRSRADNHDAMRRFIACCDPELIGILRQFDDGWWPVYALCARCPPAMSLLRNNPALAMLCAGATGPGLRSTSRAVQWSWRRTERLVAGKRATILKALGGRGTRSAERFLRRIPARCVHPHMLYQAWLLIVSGGFRALVHQPRVNAAVLRCAHDPYYMQLVAAEFLSRLGADTSLDRWSDLERFDPYVLLRDTAAMKQRLDAPMPMIRTPNQLIAEHNDAMRALCPPHRPQAPTFDRAALEALVFPAPPVADTDAIVALRSYSDLVAESAAQDNCVDAADYATETAAGRYYVYRVLEPTRATLGLLRRRGRWSIEQLKGPANGKVPAETRAVVLQWMKQSGGVIRPGSDN